MSLKEMLGLDNILNKRVFILMVLSPSLFNLVLISDFMLDIFLESVFFYQAHIGYLTL